MQAGLWGSRYAHHPERRASRDGHIPSQVVLGGRQVAIHRPHARRDGKQVASPSAQTFANVELLNGRVVE